MNEFKNRYTPGECLFTLLFSFTKLFRTNNTPLSLFPFLFLSIVERMCYYERMGEGWRLIWKKKRETREITNTNGWSCELMGYITSKDCVDFRMWAIHVIWMQRYKHSVIVIHSHIILPNVVSVMNTKKNVSFMILGNFWILFGVAHSTFHIYIYNILFFITRNRFGKEKTKNEKEITKG
jgi:hypothetical protein